MTKSDGCGVVVLSRILDVPALSRHGHPCRGGVVVVKRGRPARRHDQIRAVGTHRGRRELHHDVHRRARAQVPRSRQRAACPEPRSASGEQRRIGWGLDKGKDRLRCPDAGVGDRHKGVPRGVHRGGHLHGSGRELELGHVTEGLYDQGQPVGDGRDDVVGARDRQRPLEHARHGRVHLQEEVTNVLRIDDLGLARDDNALGGPDAGQQDVEDRNGGRGAVVDPDVGGAAASLQHLDSHRRQGVEVVGAGDDGEAPEKRRNSAVGDLGQPARRHDRGRGADEHRGPDPLGRGGRVLLATDDEEYRRRVLDLGHEVGTVGDPRQELVQASGHDDVHVRVGGWRTGGVLEDGPADQPVDAVTARILDRPDVGVE